MKKGRIIIGLSGGVDSSVAAYLLKEQGYEVIGLFMKNWHDESVTLSNECPWLEDSNDAMLVAEKIGIPFQTVDLSREYKERIVDYMFDEYSKGRTPNPDVLCNREIKFDVFLKIAISFGADYVATGHYCQKKSFKNQSGTKIYQLIAGKDNKKDQSYFLCQLSQKQLSNVLFPIGHLNKDQVRKIALKQNLITAEKKDSQGLCFIGKVKLPDFLQQQLKPKMGKIIETVLKPIKTTSIGCSFGMDEAFDFLGVPKNKRIEIPNGIKPIEGFNKEQEKSKWVKRLNLPEDSEFITSIGRVSFQKGHETFIHNSCIDSISFEDEIGEKAFQLIKNPHFVHDLLFFIFSLLKNYPLLLRDCLFLMSVK